VTVGEDLAANPWIEVRGVFWNCCSVLVRNSRTVRRLTYGQSAGRGSSGPEPSFLTVVLSFDRRTVRGSSADSTPPLSSQVQNAFSHVVFSRV
jgi:hypothetical protein